MRPLCTLGGSTIQYEPDSKVVTECAKCGRRPTPTCTFRKIAHYARFAPRENEQLMVIICGAQESAEVPGVARVPVCVPYGDPLRMEAAQMFADERVGSSWVVSAHAPVCRKVTEGG